MDKYVIKKSHAIRTNKSLGDFTGLTGLGFTGGAK